MMATSTSSIRAPAPRGLLPGHVQQEALRLGVVVGDGDPGEVEGVQHGEVELDQHLVAP